MLCALSPWHVKGRNNTAHTHILAHEIQVQSFLYHSSMPSRDKSWCSGMIPCASRVQVNPCSCDPQILQRSCSLPPDVNASALSTQFRTYGHMDPKPRSPDTIALGTRTENTYFNTQKSHLTHRLRVRTGHFIMTEFCSKNANSNGRKISTC